MSVRADVGGGAVIRPTQAQADAAAPVAIERALSIYQQLQERDQSAMIQARKILTHHIYGMIDQGECDEQRLTVGGLIYLKSVERDHAVKSVYDCSSKSRKKLPP
jgi:hypothetical protein